MSRSQRRHPELFKKRLKTNSLTDDQNKLIDKLAIEKSELFIQTTANIINECYFEAMRTNRVGKERAMRILNRTEELIKIKASEGDK